MSALLEVHIIIHNDYSHIENALRSLIEAGAQQKEIYITVNTNASIEFEHLKAAFPDINYILNDQPEGFATNHNHALKITKAPYVLLLNDDVELAPNVINSVVSYLDDNPKVGIASPRIINPDETPQLTSFSFPTLPRMIYKVSGLGYFTRQGSYIRNLVVKSGLANVLGAASLSDNTETQFVPVVVGVAMFVRRKAYEQVGGMTEDTIVYGEEFTWQWRMKRAGWDIAIVADEYIKHFNLAAELNGWQLAEHRKGMLSFFCRHRPRWQVWILRAAIIYFHGLRWLFNLFFAPKDRQGDAMAIKLALTWSPPTPTD